MSLELNLIKVGRVGEDGTLDEQMEVIYVVERDSNGENSVKCTIEHIGNVEWLLTEAFSERNYFGEQKVSLLPGTYSFKVWNCESAGFTEKYYNGKEGYYQIGEHGNAVLNEIARNLAPQIIDFQAKERLKQKMSFYIREF